MGTSRAPAILQKQCSAGSRQSISRKSSWLSNMLLDRRTSISIGNCSGRLGVVHRVRLIGQECHARFDNYSALCGPLSSWIGASGTQKSFRGLDYSCCLEFSRDSGLNIIPRRRLASQVELFLLFWCCMTPRQFAIDVVRKLQQAGFEALWAGGCVRDQLLGRRAERLRRCHQCAAGSRYVSCLATANVADRRGIWSDHCAGRQNRRAN